MKKMIHTLICSILFCCACSDSDTGFNPPTQAKQQITVSFRCEEMSSTRAAAETRIDDINLYLFPKNGDPGQHMYIAPARTLVVEIPKGDYQLYAIANLGEDAGYGTQDFVRALRTRRDPSRTGAPIPMSVEKAVSVRKDMHLDLSLIRAVAKVNFSYTVAPDFAKTFRVKSVQLCCVPRSAALFASSRTETDEGAMDMPAQETNATTYSDTYYLLENKQGQVAEIGSQQQKDQTNAPKYATYIAITGEVEEIKVVYRIYLGENNTTDFNVQRNRIYTIDARILGMNTLDWRVSTTELSVEPFAESYTTHRAAIAKVKILTSNVPDNTFYLSYRIEKGSGIVAIDGQQSNPDTTYPIHSQAGLATANIAYMQSVPGEVSLRLTITDNKGFRLERQLATTFKNPELTLTHTQQGSELTAYDRAFVDFSISQPGYGGSYTVQVEGVPTLFRNLTDDINPATTFTVNGNGQHRLRIRPETVGANPYKITVTDEKGNTKSFESSVTGIKTVSHFKLSFSKAVGMGLDLVVECTHPVLEDVALIVKPMVSIISRDGKISNQGYMMYVVVESGRTKGRTVISLDIGNNVQDYFVSSVDVIFKKTASDNGMVEYVLQGN